MARWTLAAPDPERLPRPNAAAQLAMLRRALGDATTGVPRARLRAPVFGLRC